MTERDEYDEQAERLMPDPPREINDFVAGEWNVVKIYRPAVAAALREAGKENARLKDQVNMLAGMSSWRDRAQLAEYQLADVDTLRREVERLTHELLVIGDMAVVDFDDPVVNMVDRVIPNGSKTYADRRKSEVMHYRELVAEVAALKAKLATYVDAQKQPLAQSESMALSWMNRALDAEDRLAALKAKLALHQRFHDKVGCPGGEYCYVCSAEIEKVKP